MQLLDAFRSMDDRTRVPRLPDGGHHIRWLHDGWSHAHISATDALASEECQLDFTVRGLAAEACVCQRPVRNVCFSADWRSWIL